MSQSQRMLLQLAKGPDRFPPYETRNMIFSLRANNCQKFEIVECTKPQAAFRGNQAEVDRIYQYRAIGRNIPLGSPVSSRESSWYLVTFIGFQFLILLVSNRIEITVFEFLSM